MSTAVVEGLRTVGGRKLAVATAYNNEVNARLTAFLKESGFEVLKLKGLGIVDMDAVTRDRAGTAEVQSRRARIRAGGGRDEPWRCSHSQQPVADVPRIWNESR
jgi:hypothetical protein